MNSTMMENGKVIKERVLIANENQVGILTLPLEEATFPCVLIFNAGLIHRVGPNRIFVKLSRNLANLGISSFRFDFSGIGDSKVSLKHMSFEDYAEREAIQVMDTLGKIGIKRFIIIGLCSGVEIAYNLGKKDSRVVGLCCINGTYLKNEDIKNFPIGRSIAVRYYKKYIFDFQRWKKILAGKSNAFTYKNINEAKKILIAAIKKRIIPKKEKTRFLDLSDKITVPSNNYVRSLDIKVLNIFSEGSASLDIYNLLIKPSIVTLRDLHNDLVQNEIIKDVDHVFTPVWSHEVLIRKVSSWIKNNF